MILPVPLFEQDAKAYRPSRRCHRRPRLPCSTSSPRFTWLSHRGRTVSQARHNETQRHSDESYCYNDDVATRRCRPTRWTQHLNRGLTNGTSKHAVLARRFRSMWRGRTLVLTGRPRAWRWMREPGAPGLRHRGGVPWDAMSVPHRWHACRPQTVELYREGRILTGTYHCACGAVTDGTGAWCFRNSRRRDPAGLRSSRTPQPVRTRVVAGTVPHPGARHRLRSHPAGSA